MVGFAVDVFKECAVGHELVHQQWNLCLQTTPYEFDHDAMVDLGQNDDFVNELVSLGLVH